MRPAFQPAWILEKLVEWTDGGGDPVALLGRDAILDAVMLYWLPAAAAAARLDGESLNISPPVRSTCRWCAAPFRARSSAHRGGGRHANIRT